MKNFDRTALKTLRLELDAALAVVAKKNGIVLSLGNISFSSGEFRTKLTGNVKSAPVLNLGGDDADLVRLSARATVLPAQLLGRAFVSNGRRFTLTAVKKSRPKYPYSGIGPSGGRYKFTVDQVANGLV